MRGALSRGIGGTLGGVASQPKLYAARPAPGSVRDALLRSVPANEDWSTWTGGYDSTAMELPTSGGNWIDCHDCGDGQLWGTVNGRLRAYEPANGVLQEVASWELPLPSGSTLIGGRRMGGNLFGYLEQHNTTTYATVVSVTGASLALVHRTMLASGNSGYYEFLPQVSSGGKLFGLGYISGSYIHYVVTASGAASHAHSYQNMSYNSAAVPSAEGDRVFVDYGENDGQTSYYSLNSNGLFTLHRTLNTACYVTMPLSSTRGIGVSGNTVYKVALTEADFGLYSSSVIPGFIHETSGFVRLNDTTAIFLRQENSGAGPIYGYCLRLTGVNYDTVSIGPGRIIASQGGWSRILNGGVLSNGKPIIMYKGNGSYVYRILSLS